VGKCRLVLYQGNSRQFGHHVSCHVVTGRSKSAGEHDNIGFLDTFAQQWSDGSIVGNDYYPIHMVPEGSQLLRHELAVLVGYDSTCNFSSNYK